MVGTSSSYHWYDYDGRRLLSKVYASTPPTKPSSADVTYTYRPGGLVIEMGTEFGLSAGGGASLRLMSAPECWSSLDSMDTSRSAG